MPNADWDIDSDIRNVSGLLVKLEGLSDGGSQVVVWDRERKAWSAPDDPSVMSVADLMAAKPAPMQKYIVATLSIRDFCSVILSSLNHPCLNKITWWA